MAKVGGYDLRRSLVERQIAIPYVQSAFRDTSHWPAQELLQIDNPNRHDSATDSAFHPSIHAKMCPLGCYLTLEPTERNLLLPEPKTFTSVFTPLMGTVVHTIVQQKLIIDGIVKPEDVEVALVNEERNWRGHADLLLRGELVDIKTTRAERFRLMKGPQEYWKYQMHPYMDRLDLGSAVILVIEMGWPFAMKEYRIPMNPGLLDEIYTKWEFVSDCIEAKTPPSHEGCEDKYCLVLDRLSPEQKKRLG